MEEQIQQPSASPIYNSQDTAPISIGDWMITILISFIPLLGLIMLFVWGFSAGTNPNKANWAKASLIWVAIGYFIIFLFWGTIFAALMASSGMDSYGV